MRQEKTLKVVMNHVVNPETALKPQGKKGVSWCGTGCCCLEETFLNSTHLAALRTPTHSPPTPATPGWMFNSQDLYYDPEGIKEPEMLPFSFGIKFRTEEIAGTFKEHFETAKKGNEAKVNFSEAAAKWVWPGIG